MRIASMLCALLGACRMTETQQNTWVHDPGYYSIEADGSRTARYSRIEEFTAHGTQALGERARIVNAYATAQHAPAPTIELVVFASELPPGIRLDGGVIDVTPDAPYEVIGQYQLAYVLATAPMERDILDDLERLAFVTGGDAVVIELQHDGLHVRGISGLVLHHRATVAPKPAATHHSVQLSYHATGAGCLTADELRAQIAARLGYAPWADAALPLHAEIAAADHGFVATVQLGETAPRKLTGTSCHAVTAAVISIVVIQIDESR
jgi:hypothetical protein